MPLGNYYPLLQYLAEIAAQCALSLYIGVLLYLFAVCTAEFTTTTYRKIIK